MDMTTTKALTIALEAEALTRHSSNRVMGADTGAAGTTTSPKLRMPRLQAKHQVVSEVVSVA
jgi:hypothetical protein